MLGRGEFEAQLPNFGLVSGENTNLIGSAQAAQITWDSRRGHTEIVHQTVQPSNRPTIQPAFSAYDLSNLLFEACFYARLARSKVKLR